MKRIAIICLGMFIWNSYSVLGQEIISTQGTSFYTSTIQLDWTLGEIVTATLKGDNRELTQGFYQPAIVARVTSVTEYGKNISVEVFPNPVAENLNIITHDAQKLFYELRDIKGQRVYANYIYDGQASLMFSDLNAGIYFLSLNDGNHKQIKTYKIIKK